MQPIGILTMCLYVIKNAWQTLGPWLLSVYVSIQGSVFAQLIAIGFIWVMFLTIDKIIDKAVNVGKALLKKFEK